MKMLYSASIGRGFIGLKCPKFKFEQTNILGVSSRVQNNIIEQYYIVQVNIHNKIGGSNIPAKRERKFSLKTA